ncbi:hypothetical protein PVAP13_2KG516805 [Panicum virgatum]|uniref:Uncharacterized protein n=1 Tax=Panicum virgatum TaxID=38727 RepID=A0A8T0WN60_PANVG|nr:hypothetical protein PVAP13_2KG516805 [Panicum virgatum]
MKLKKLTQAVPSSPGRRVGLLVGSQARRARHPLPACRRAGPRSRSRLTPASRAGCLPRQRRAARAAPVPARLVPEPHRSCPPAAAPVAASPSRVGARPPAVAPVATRSPRPRSRPPLEPLDAGTRAPRPRTSWGRPDLRPATRVPAPGRRPPADRSKPYLRSQVTETEEHLRLWEGRSLSFG